MGREGGKKNCLAARGGGVSAQLVSDQLAIRTVKALPARDLVTIHMRLGPV